MSPFVIGIAVFFLAAAACGALFFAITPRSRVVDERFADLAVKVRVSQGALEGDLQDETMLRMLFRWAAKRVPPPNLDTPAGEKLQQTLAQAGYLKSSAPQTYQITRVLLAVGGGTLGLLIGLIMHASASQPLMFAFGGVGLGIFVAIRIVGTECERHGQEIGTELNLVTTDISSGATLGQALRGLAERTAVEDIKPLAATLIQSEQLGAQIAPALKSSSDALRTRRRIRAEESAQKASIKILFPLVLFVLPAMIAVIVGPAMISVLRTLTGSAG